MHNIRERLRAQRLRRPMNRGDLDARAEFERLRFDLMLSLLRRRIRLSGARVLDLGCGCGAMAAAMREHGADVVATDSDAAFVGFGRRRFPALDLVLADARWLPFPSETFDLVWASSVIDHLAEPERSLLVEESARVLRRGGVLVLSFNSAHSIAARLLRIDRHGPRDLTFASVRRMMAGRLELVEVLPMWERPAVVARLPWLGERLVVGAAKRLGLGWLD